MNLANVVKRRTLAALQPAQNLAAKAGDSVARIAAVGGVGLGLMNGAHAAGEFTIDTTTIVATITAGVTTLSAIGIAVLSLVVVIKLFKWAQRVL